jgi:hypothetical protein
MGVQFDGEWLVQDEYVRKLAEAGYGIVRWNNKYVLHNFAKGGEAYDYDTLDELNRMLKLLVEG